MQNNHNKQKNEEIKIEKYENFNILSVNVYDDDVMNLKAVLYIQKLQIRLHLQEKLLSLLYPYLLQMFYILINGISLMLLVWQS